MQKIAVFILISIFLICCKDIKQPINQENCNVLKEINEKFYNQLRVDLAKAKEFSDSAFLLLDKSCTNEIGNTYYYHGSLLVMTSNYEAALDTYKIAKNYYAIQKDTGSLAKVIGNIGVTYKRLSQFNEAIPYFDTSYQLAIFMRDTTTMLNAVANKNICLAITGQDSLVIATTLPLLKLAKNYSDQSKLATFYDNIGTAYLNMEVWDKALYYFRKEEKLYDDKSSSLGGVYNNISIIYLKTAQLDSAYYYANQGEINKKKDNDEYGLAFSYTNKGAILRNQKQLQKALAYHQKAEQVRRKIKHEKGLKDTYFNISKVLMDMKNYDTARFYLDKGIALSENMTAKDADYEELLITGEFYANTKQFEKATIYYVAALELRDSLHQERLLKSFTALEEKYKNQLLQKDNTVKAKALEVANFRSRIALIGFVLILSIVIALGYFYNLIRKRNNQIELQNEQLSKSFNKINQLNRQLNQQNLELEKSKEILEGEQQDLIDKITELTLDDPILIGKSFIKPSSILYIESEGNYIQIVQKDDRRRERLTVKETITLLPPQFVRIQKGIIVNTKQIDYYRKKQVVTLDDGRQVNVSPNYQEDLENILVN